MMNPIARLEAIRMLLAFASFMDFKLYQMDVKSAFPNGFTEYEVYVKQPLVLKTLILQIMYLNYLKHCMD